MGKVCKICKLEKELDEFYKQERCNFGVKSMCKSCYGIWDKGRDQEKRRKSQRIYMKKRRSDPLIKLRLSLGSRTSNFCRAKGLKRRKNTTELLGITLPEFKKWIESKFDSNMNWGNYSSYWTIDHIIPLSSANTIEEMYRLCHYTNLQPLEAIENIKKSNKILKLFNKDSDLGLDLSEPQIIQI